MATIDDALSYHELGLCVIPVRHGTKGEALVKWKQYQHRRPTENECSRMFNGKECNIAILCGKVSGGLVVRDFDSQASYASWSKDHQDLANSLPTVVTSRGRHVYATVETVPRSKTFEDGELRSTGEYVLAPHSRHPDGPIYFWDHSIGKEIPRIDLNSSGFLPVDTEGTEGTEATEDPENSGHNKRDSFGNESFLSLPAIQDAIDRTVAIATGTRHYRLFELARELKAIPELREGSAHALEPIVFEWHQRSVENINTKPFEDSLFEFFEAWSKVKYAIGEGPVELALERAERAALPECAKRFQSDESILLVKLCRELQRLHGSSPFFLDCRTAGRLLGISRTQANKYLRGLCNLKILRAVSVG